MPGAGTEEMHSMEEGTSKGREVSLPVDAHSRGKGIAITLGGLLKSG